MAQEHGVLLTESEQHDIEMACLLKNMELIKKLVPENDVWDVAEDIDYAVKKFLGLVKEYEPSESDREYVFKDLLKPDVSDFIKENFKKHSMFSFFLEMDNKNATQ